MDPWNENKLYEMVCYSHTATVSLLWIPVSVIKLFCQCKCW